MLPAGQIVGVIAPVALKQKYPAGQRMQSDYYTLFW
jgi:hypothetical protein